MPLNSIPAAAARLGVSDRSVYNYLMAGDLQAVKLGARTMIADAELDRFEASLPSATFRQKAPAAPQAQQDDAALAESPIAA